MHPQSTDGLGAQVALLQSRYLSKSPVVKPETAVRIVLAPASQSGARGQKIKTPVSLPLTFVWSGVNGDDLLRTTAIKNRSSYAN
jgi:hypothetical protein